MDKKLDYGNIKHQSIVTVKQNATYVDGYGQRLGGRHHHAGRICWLVQRTDFLNHIGIMAVCINFDDPISFFVLPEDIIELEGHTKNQLVDPYSSLRW